MKHATGSMPTSEKLRQQAEQASAALPSLLVEADRVAASVSQGVHGRRRVGQGETFWQFRQYQTGDAVHQIDWRQSARTTPLYIRETEWEAAQTVWLWRDLSPSMVYRSKPSLAAKFERRDILLLALSSLLIRGGERFALAGSGERPLSGPASQERLWTMMKNQTPYDNDLSELNISRHAHVVMFGDFLSPLVELEKKMASLANRNIKGHLVRIIDPAEEAFPFEGRVKFFDTESMESSLLGNVGKIRKDYQKSFVNHGNGLFDLARSWGWSLTTHHTDQAPTPTLLSLYMSLSGETL